MNLDQILANNAQLTAVNDQEERVFISYDLHMSDKRSDRHKDYWSDCMRICEETLKMVEEHRITHFVLVGDLIGRMKDKNFVTREAFMFFTLWLQKLNRLTDNRVYVVEGNHDQSDKLTDYQMFLAMGLIRNVPYFDTKITRVHLINYGEETRAIDYRENANNIAVMHGELTVDGATNWFFNSKYAISVSGLTNLKGITRIYSGHIHVPSPKPIEYAIEGVNGLLHYMGCPTKPTYNRNDYEYVYPVIIKSTDTTVSEEVIPYKLQQDIWLQSINLQETEDMDTGYEQYEEDEVIDVAKLSEVLETIRDYNLLGLTDFRTQIKTLSALDADLGDFILDYVDQAEGEMQDATK